MLEFWVSYHMFFAWINISCYKWERMQNYFSTQFYNILKYTKILFAVTSKCTWKQNVDFSFFKFFLKYALHTQFYEWTIQNNYKIVTLKLTILPDLYFNPNKNYYDINEYQIATNKYTSPALPLEGYRGPDCPPALPRWYTVCALSGSSVFWWGPAVVHPTWLGYSTSRLSAPLSPVETIPTFTFFAHNFHVT